MNEELRTQLRQAIGVTPRNLPDFGVDTSRNNVPVFERYVIGQNEKGRHYLYETTEHRGIGSFSIVTLDVIQETSGGTYATRAAKIIDLDVIKVDGFDIGSSEKEKVESAIELLLACASFDRTFVVPQIGVLRMR